jgi:outer membrane receptor for ferric coprogen and ferric-rhodotorulic acid
LPPALSNSPRLIRRADWDYRTRLVSRSTGNMFDKHYYESLSGIRTVVPGAPRSWLATLDVAF